MSCQVTLFDEHAAQLRALVLPSNGHEGAAYLLLRRVSATDPWNSARRTRYVSREIIPVAQEDVLSSSPQHISTRTRTWVRVLRRARNTDCQPAFVHGHPGGFTRFSECDDANEPDLATLATNRNGGGLISIVFAAPRAIFGRLWQTPTTARALATITVVGRVLEIHGSADTDHAPFQRQELAFGPALTRSLAGLRIGIIGCGATGSATAMLLARLGAGRLLLVDDDSVAQTNLNRLHGASASDIGRPKVDVVRDAIKQMGLGTQTAVFQGWVGDAAARDLLKSCDVVFGCTDDHDGRLLLNRLAYFYLIPVFDMGIGIDAVDGRISHADSRVTVIGPGARCLLCRGVVNPALAREDALARSAPAEYVRRRAEGEAYIRGGGLPNPAVVTMTTGVACLAVDELIQRLTCYRRTGPTDHRVIKHHLEQDSRPGPRQQPCTICRDRSYWGLGDTVPFLDRVG